MAEFFELSLISKCRIDFDLWEKEFSLIIGQFHYFGCLNFFKGKEVYFNEYFENEIWVYEISIRCLNLFARDNIINKVELLLQDVDQISRVFSFEYAIANIETNSSFILSSNGALLPSKDIVLGSSLIFIPKFKLDFLEINLYHLILKKGETACLFNPLSGILYTSEGEKYKILSDSFKH